MIMFWLIPPAAAVALLYIIKRKSPPRSRRQTDFAVALVGPVNGGKSTLFRALTGLEVEDVIDDREGWYHKIAVGRSSSGLKLFDHPGFGDPSDPSLGYVDGNADVVVMVADRFDDQIVKELKRLKAHYSGLILVRSKIDTVHASKRRHVLRHIRNKLRERSLADVSVTSVCGGPKEGEVDHPTPPERVEQLKKLITKRLRQRNPYLKRPWRGKWALLK
jgi:GTP-binding protein EngB required for normal cell division